MALRSLGYLVRGAIRARTRSSSPGIPVQGALGSAAGSEADALYGLRNLASHVDARLGSVAAATAISALAGSRGLHSRAAAQTAQSVRARTGYSLPGIVVQASMGSVIVRGARRFHSLRDLVAEHNHGTLAALFVTTFSVFAGILYMIDTDESDKARTEEDVEDPCMRTDAYLRYIQAAEDVERERASYNKTMRGKKDVVQEYMEDDQAMRARFEEWMKEYGRTYQDEEEKARRFKIFKSVARFADVTAVVAAELGSDACMGLNDFADRNDDELSGLCGTEPISDDEYLSMMAINDASDKKATEQKLQQQESKD